MKQRPNKSKAGRKSENKKTPGEPALSLSPRRKWLFRFFALVVMPVLLIVLVAALLEIGLRLGGYGYDTHFFRSIRVGGQEYFLNNEEFTQCFFPEQLSRWPDPFKMPAVKSPDTIRIFIFGESAAMGDPQPAYGASRYMEVLLRERFPGKKFEVINLGITAINSHVILPIARECARHDGDFWIVYMGNNEMVGPFGAATVFGAQALSRRAAQINLAIQRTHTGQLLVSSEHFPPFTPVFAVSIPTSLSTKLTTTICNCCLRWDCSGSARWCGSWSSFIATRSARSETGCPTSPAQSLWLVHWALPESWSTACSISICRFPPTPPSITYSAPSQPPRRSCSAPASASLCPRKTTYSPLRKSSESRKTRKIRACARVRENPMRLPAPLMWGQPPRLSSRAKLDSASTNARAAGPVVSGTLPEWTTVWSGWPDCRSSPAPTS